MGVDGVHRVRMELPLGMMFFCKADQVLNLDFLTIIGNHCAVVTSEHLVDEAGDDSQIRLRQTILERSEDQVEAAFAVGEFPGFHVIA